MNLKIIKIINNNRVVINAGKNEEIKKGNKFEVYVEGEELIDEEGINYGKLNFVKAEIEAIQVEDKMTICANAKREATGLSSMVGMIGETSQGSRRASLPIDLKEISSVGSAGDDEVIRIGDKVREI